MIIGFSIGKSTDYVNKILWMNNLML